MWGLSHEGGSAEREGGDARPSNAKALEGMLEGCGDWAGEELCGELSEEEGYE